MIELLDIRKKFGGQEVLKGISAQFQPGQTSLIIGTSGSGKTVTLKCMVGLIEVDSGAVMYDGKNFSAMTNEERIEIRKDIGMLFQGGALFDSMTIEENVMFPLNMFSKMTKAEKQKRVDECLDRVNLSGKNKLHPSEISGGMKKRVGIARAIVMKPKFLFCDEPNSGLDPKTSLVIDKLIREITVDLNMTTVVNTHDMNSVMEIGDHIIFLWQGLKNWEGNKQEVLHSGNKELDDFIFASEFLKKVRENYDKLIH
ncbi:MAG: ATP-binding cassette domain-containing protein [Chitinophagales bacterium]|jgi:phospholipid/cholesterol/gamma-HCH transport system ATP-binding protein|nr:ATP-binding cassette domain-containing protein [Chitinophagales bacterium]